MAETVVIDGLGIIHHDSPIPLYFQLATFAEDQIKSKRWLPEQRLPSEQELCDRLNVSRTVIRQAMAELERKGLIWKQNGKRSSICHPRYEGSLMQSLTGFYQDAIAHGQRPSTDVLAAAEEEASAEVAEALQLKERTPVVMLNRLRALDGEPEVLVITYLPAAKVPGLLQEDFRNQSLYGLLQKKYGLVIASGHRSIEAISAGRQEANLLNVKPGSALLLLKSIGLTEDGVPLEYFVAKHRGDRSKFQVKLVRSSA